MSAPVVFDNTQIGRGLRPICQYGSVEVIAGNSVRLLDSKQSLIVEAPLAEVGAHVVRWTFGQTVALVIGTTRYHVSPGFGTRRLGGLRGVRLIRADVRRLIELLGAAGGSAAA